jgi:membrane peptidoglycan carboxypeptidase
MRFLLYAALLAPGLTFAFVPVATLSRALAFTPWGFALPSDDVLRKALRSCGSVRENGREYTLCPSRLAYKDFPRHLADALIASEDRAFFGHEGIDKRAIAHAALANLARTLRERRLVARRGGSTITQQFARTLFLDERDGLHRKIEELALAPRIEAVLSKEQILAGYMNVVPHARGMNGFDAAARHFFGVPVGSVDLAEAALLVGMLPAPNDRDPVRRPEPAYAAAVRVLERMADQGRIGEAELTRAEQALRSRILGRKLKRGRMARLGQAVSETALLTVSGSPEPR